MNPVRAFNIPAKDMETICHFYEVLFDWRIRRMTGSAGNYHFAITTPSDEDGEPIMKGAINGGIFREGTHGINETFLELTVESIDNCLNRAVATGGRTVTEKKRMGDFFFAIIQDPEGNYLGLWEDIKE